MKELWIPLSGAMAQQANVDTIANNIANANTPGFKKDQQIFKEYLTALNKDTGNIDLPQKEWKPEDFYRTDGAESGMVKADGTYTIFEQGQLSPTSNPLDVAINGKGFFEVLSPNGVRYTRKGNFSVSSSGLLVNDQGFPILSRLDPATLKATPLDQAKAPNAVPQPEERTINLFNSGPVSISIRGEIFQKNNQIGQLSLVEFRDPNALVKEGNSLFINKGNDNISDQEIKSTVHQGFMESSNVNPLVEMSALIKANRNLESIQKAIKAYDHMAEKSAVEIGKF